MKRNQVNLKRNQVERSETQLSEPNLTESAPDVTNAKVSRATRFAAGGAWGASTCDDDKSVCWAPMEPINPGMTPGTEKPRIILGIDVDYPPYGTLA